MEWLGFSGLFIDRGFVWTIATFPFFHTGPLLLIVNLLGLHFIGRSVESELGIRNFYWLCALSVLFGALLWLVFHYSDQSTYLSGSTCVVLSLLTFFCFSHPDRPITLLLLFVLPVTIKPKYILMGVLGLELFGFLFWELRGSAGGATYSSHLGGMLAGLLFIGLFFLGGFFQVSFLPQRSLKPLLLAKNLVFSLPKPKQPNRVIPSICRIIRSFKPRSIEFWTKSTRRVSVL